MEKTPIPDVPIFADSSPRKNPAARWAYRLAILSLVPIIAVPLGAAAVACGVVALARYRSNPKLQGYPQGMAAVLIGSVTSVSNAAGLYCLARGFGWVGDSAG
jgi:hypothetical protein